MCSGTDADGSTGQFFQLLAHTHIQIALIMLRIMNQCTQVPQSKMLQPACHNIQSRSFVTNQQHSLSTSQVVADDVCDRLALSGTWRSMNHESLAVACEANSARLTWICHGDQSHMLRQRWGNGSRFGNRFRGWRGGLRVAFQRFIDFDGGKVVEWIIEFNVRCQKTLNRPGQRFGGGGHFLHIAQE